VPLGSASSGAVSPDQAPRGCLPLPWPSPPEHSSQAGGPPAMRSPPLALRPGTSPKVGGARRYPPLPRPSSSALPQGRREAGQGRCGRPERPVTTRSSFSGGLSGMMWDSRRGPGRTRRFVLDLPPVVGENEHKDASPESVLGLPLALRDRTESLRIEAPGRLSSLGDLGDGAEWLRIEAPGRPGKPGPLGDRWEVEMKSPDRGFLADWAQADPGG